MFHERYNHNDLYAQTIKEIFSPKNNCSVETGYAEYYMLSMNNAKLVKKSFKKIMIQMK